MSASPPLQLNPFDAAFDALLVHAHALGASDVHIEPFGDIVRVRMRVDGVLRVVQRIDDAAWRSRFLEVAKRRCGFDMGRLDQPQDARFATSSPPLDYRAALVPLLEGESIVLRLLQRNVDFSLDRYRLRDDAKADLRHALHKRSGLIVVSGPTGSGKSTLLYSALAELDRTATKVYTLEDPVEYRLDGVTQSQVDADSGRTFAAMLRALMRGDPDVILVGEVRDARTAEAALHAAMTGHLVLTTVHANSTAEIVERLAGLGVEPAVYQACLQFSSAQRLLPKLCQACLEPDPGASHLLQAVFGQAIHSRRAAGCQACGHTGIAGRVLLFEWEASQRDMEGRPVLERKGGLRADALTYLSEGVIDASTAVGL